MYVCIFPLMILEAVDYFCWWILSPLSMNISYGPSMMESPLVKKDPVLLFIFFDKKQNTPYIYIYSLWTNRLLIYCFFILLCKDCNFFGFHVWSSGRNYWKLCCLLYLVMCWTWFHYTCRFFDKFHCLICVVYFFLFLQSGKSCEV